MDDQAVIRTYGNTELPVGTEVRPLVTFALFAYNQEKYIREAVEGAFSQTYSPLEIILSDDCSSDRTFEIMEKMAAGYDGPHMVRVIQTKVNLGVTRHVLLRGREARGEIVVLAAGDDISKPQRCDYHVPVYKDASVMGVTGGYELIDHLGNKTSPEIFDPLSQAATLMQPKLFSKICFPYVVLQGSTASYRKAVFDFALPEGNLGASEDNLFNFLIYAHGFRVARLDVSLVMYRTHAEALSNRGKLELSPEDRELSVRSSAKKNIATMQTFEWIAVAAGNRSSVDFSEIERRRNNSQEILGWSDICFGARFLSVLRSILNLETQMVRWKLLRIFGKFPRYQPKIFIARFWRR